MKEYAYPSGRLTTAIDPADWITPAKWGYVVLLVVLCGVMIWRFRRKATAWDAIGWGTLFFATFMIIQRAFHHDFAYGMALLPQHVWLSLLTLAALTISMFRLARSWPARLGVAVLAYFGLMIVLAPTVTTPREVARRTQCKNNLKYIGLALHNYHDFHQQFPFAGIVTSDAGQVCSWRIPITDWIEARPKWHQYRYNESWDSPFNSQYQEQCPSYYKCPSHQTERRFTDYAMLRGPGTIGGDGLTATSITNMTDGTSNTAVIVEACGCEIIWTEPKDVELTGVSLGVNLPGDQPGHSRGIISSYHVGGAHVLLGDGAVRFVSEKIDKNVLKALTTINGGEKLPEDW